MLYLVEISVPLAVVRQTTLSHDPLIAGDPAYSAKTWLHTVPGIAPRPWAATRQNNILRIVGWCRSVPVTTAMPSGVKVGWRTFAADSGSVHTFCGTFAALRNLGKKPNRPAMEIDAARNRPDARAAYTAWLLERLAPAIAGGDITALEVTGHHHRRALYKTARHPDKTITTGLVPEVSATLTFEVHDTEATEAWLLNGIGPQKAFGYGALLPC